MEVSFAIFLRRVAAPLWGVVLVAGGAVPAAAQPGVFGQNKIQYTDFEWRVLESEHFDLYFYPEEDTLARTALRIAENSYGQIAARFRHEVTRRIPLIIYSSHHDFEQTNISPFFLPEGVAGFTEFLKGRVALPFNGSYHDFEHVIHHELVHVFQLSKLAEVYRLHFRNSLVSPPLWFTEGMADHWSEEWNSTGDLFLSDLVLNNLLPSIPELWRYSGTFVIYKIGQDLVRFLERTYGPDLVPLLYDELWRANSFEEALEHVTEIPMAELNERWHYDLAQRYYPKVQEDAPLELAAKPLAVKGGANFQPMVPPRETGLDPDTYYFLSPRTGFTNIYRGSLQGRERNIERVIEGERRPEFESFHGFESRLGVSRDGVLAFVSKFHERDGLFFYDLKEEKLIGQWQFEGIVSLRSPTFRPDGRAVVLAGLSEDGRQDLYLFDVATEVLAPLTRDRYLDDDPSWSPDGKTIAFVSDRTPWGKDGAKNIFLLDLEAGTIEPFTLGPWSDASPTWSDSGSRLAYSSDRDGTPQLFVADSTGSSFRVTSFLGGALSPSWVPGKNELVFTGMANQRFGIYRAPLEAKGDTLPPPDTRGLLVAGHAEADSVFPGTPKLWRAWTWDVGTDSLKARQVAYRSRYTLDFAQGGIALEPVQGAGEGVQAFLSDQLGDQIIYFQVSNTADQIGDVFSRFNLGVSYLNIRRRLNYGASVFHFAGDFLDERGFAYFERRLGATTTISYPYSRFARVESSLGLLYSDREADSFRPAREALLAVNYLSYVYDNALWFSTGPMDGTRFRVTLGLNTNLDRVEVENVSAVVDYRHYFRTGLRTAYAVRLQGRLSEGELPQRFLLGGSWSFRGYPRRGLVGTRALLLNQEWRYPLLTGIALGLPVGVVQLPPVQGAFFLDAGQAWEEGEAPSRVLGSFGLGVRMSLGGFLVLRLDFAKRTDFRSVEPQTEVDFFVGYNY